ncbi:CHAT domain-containing protein [Lactifluus subvellereus]|nr:CHAT domain-containing protein [Lactifluus subvellereus]
MKLQRWLSSHPYSHTERRYYLLNLANVRLDHHKLLHTNEDLDNAILHYTEAVLLPLRPLDNTGPDIISCLFLLARTLHIRFLSTRQPGDLKSSIEYLRHLLNLALPPRVREDITVELVRALGVYVKLEAGSRTHSAEEILVLCRELLALNISGGHLVNVIVILGSLAVAASRENWEEPLDQVIEYMREAIEMCSSESYMAYAVALTTLAQTLTLRFTRKYSIGDLQEAIAILLLQKSIDHESGNPSDKLQDACTWAFLARATAHPSVSTAYQIAMSWMQRSLVFAPTLHTKHAQLTAIQQNNMPLAYASYRVEASDLEQAVETLEQGRALLWSEMRGLRTSIDRLSVANPALATKLAIINRDLETLTMSIPIEGNRGTDGSSAQGEGGIDMFGQLLEKQRTLLDQRNILTSQIQELPGFENFLKTPSFDTLRAAAERGPVIIVNHCRWRSDILIVLHHSPPFLITTPEGFYNQAKKLAERLLDTRKKHRLESLQYQRTLHSVLKKLYELVGQPVINKLRELNIPEQSRVWWCPTSVFCSLPLHAMGPIPSQDKVKKYFSDMYISSYTPTLSALIKSREPGEQTSDSPSLLVIAPPDKSLPGVKEEIGVIKQVLGGSIRNLILEEATSENAGGTLRHHRFAHFACHGVLEAGKPFDASFMLQGHDRLTLLDIVRSQLPAAEFALLSACHTAELTDGSIPDEALHLTAAMQYCGFRSVVGTMWAMADTDGRDLTGYFYKSMFSSEDQGVPYYERSAKALRDAVQKLRREKRVGLERWVNFVHYGA